MAPIKFEEEIKEKLELRRIEPSQESWAKLSAQLDKNKGPRRNRFWWFAIAASLIVALFSTYQLLKSPEPSMTQDGFTLEEVEIIPASKDMKTQENKLVQPADSSMPQGLITAEVEREIEHDAKPLVEDNSDKITVAKTEDKTKEDLNNLDITDINTDQAMTSTAVVELDKALIDEVIQEGKKADENKLNKETDSLLKAAQKALIMDRSMDDSAQVVSATELLDEVEQEVEPSLRSKVYEVFKGGFKKVKTAVAERNN